MKAVADFATEAPVLAKSIAQSFCEMFGATVLYREQGSTKWTTVEFTGSREEASPARKNR